MNTKTHKVIYWISLGLTSLWFGASGYFEITKNPVVWDKTIALGYPAYFIVTLGIAKLIGISALLLPGSSWQLQRLKEFVFAGLFFDIAFALISGCVVFGAAEFLVPLVACIMVATTYLMFKKVYTT